MQPTKTSRDCRFAMARFVLAWMAIPTLFRIATLLSLLPIVGNWQNLGPAVQIVVTAVPQDLFIAVQALCVVLTIRVLMRGTVAQWKASLLAILATVLFMMVHSYLLVDFLLYFKTGLRMDYAFLDFLGEAKSFASSAWEVGLGALAASVVALLVVQQMVYRQFRHAVGSLRWTWTVLLLLPASAGLSAASRHVLPPTLAYAMDNVVLGDETRLITRWFQGDSGLSDVDQEQTLAWLSPQAEDYRRIDPNYPLLKYTEGFHGEKQFDLRLEPGERPHVVFLFMESFRAVDIGVLGGKHNASPNFDRLSKEGVLFTNFYGNGVQTTRGVIAALFGVLPRFTAKAVQAHNPEMPLIGLADLFNQRGYTSAFISANSLEFEGKDKFFPRHGYAEVLGDNAVAKAFPHAPRTSWGLHDEYLMQYLADWLAAKDRRQQPAFVAAFTISHHHPWHIPDDYPAPTFDRGTNREYSRFLQTFHYADHCLGMFIDLLRQKGLDRRTIVFVLADTATPQGEHHGNFMLVNYLYEENVHIPLLILAPGRLAKPAVIDDVGSQVDLLPTVMDLFGMRGLNHAVGTSLVRRVPNRVAYFNNPFAMQYLGLRQGKDKYIFNVRAGASSLFRLDSDPQERHDVAVLAPRSVEDYQRRVTAIHDFLLRLFLTQRLVSRTTLDELRQSPSFAH
jgi:phosphoglycerol transferase MdoB-like AlkP superfamily enzyme